MQENVYKLKHFLHLVVFELFCNSCKRNCGNSKIRISKYQYNDLLVINLVSQLGKYFPRFYTSCVASLNYFIIFRNYLIIFGGQSNQFDSWSNPRTSLEKFPGVEHKILNKEVMTLVNWRFRFLVSHDSFTRITEKFKNFQMQEKF